MSPLALLDVASRIARRYAWTCEEAEDFASEAVLQVLRLPKDHGYSLPIVIQNAAISAMRQRARHTRRAVPLEWSHDLAAPVPDQEPAETARERVSALLSRLPRHYRATLETALRNDLEYEFCAIELRISQTTFRYRMAHAYEAARLVAL